MTRHGDNRAAPPARPPRPAVADNGTIWREVHNQLNMKNAQQEPPVQGENYGDYSNLRSEGPPPLSLCLRITSDRVRGKDGLSLSESNFMIGRGANAHLRVNDKEVSKRHAFIYDGLLIDHNSTNGM